VVAAAARRAEEEEIAAEVAARRAAEEEVAAKRAAFWRAEEEATKRAAEEAESEAALARLLAAEAECAAAQEEQGEDDAAGAHAGVVEDDATTSSVPAVDAALCDVDQFFYQGTDPAIAHLGVPARYAVVHKTPEGRVGLQVTFDDSLLPSGAVINRVGAPALASGTVREGDTILEINGKSTLDMQVGTPHYCLCRHNYHDRYHHPRHHQRQ
jgi:hypothetical protein